MPHNLLKIKILILFFTSFSVGSVFGQAGFKSHFKNYGLNNGVPSSQVYQILEDSKGYIWFGTDRGLVRYNGYKFKVFTVNDGLTSNVIFHLDEAPGGEIWCLGKDRKMSLFKNGQFSSFKFNDTLIKYTSPKANVLSFDVYDGGINICLWDKIGFANYFQLDNNGNYSVKKEGEGMFIYEDDQGIRVSHNTKTRDKLFYNDKLLLAFPAQMKTVNSSFADVVRNNDFIYASTGNYLMRFNVVNNKIQDTVFLSFNNNEIIDLETDDYGNIYIGTQKGLYYWRKGKDKKVELLLEDVYVSSILVDQNKGIWVGSIYKGLFYCARTNNKHLVDKDDRILDFFMVDNQIYFCYDVAKLKKLNGTVAVDMKESTRPIPAGGTFLNDDLIVVPSRNIVHTYLIDTVRNEYWLLRMSAKEIIQAPTGYLVHSNAGIQFYSANFDLNTYVNFNGFLNCFYHFGGPNRIVGLDDGVKIYSGVDKTFQCKDHLGHNHWLANTFAYRPDIPFFQSQIKDITRANDSVMLYASGHKGLYIERANKSDILLGEKNGLVSNLLDQVFFEDGHIIVTSKEGVSVINERLEMINYTADNNLLSNDIKNVVLKDDTVWVASDLGISIFPFGKTVNPTIPVHLVNAKVENKEVELAREYHLKYWEKLLEISFEALFYTKEGDIKYKYRLEGVDENWIYSKTKTVRYRNLPTGIFDFYVSVEKGDNTWTEETLLFTIHKAQPFWEHYLFILCCFLMLLASVVFIVRWLNWRYKKVQQEKIVLLNLERKTLQAQMNPHFIFNSLTSLQSLIIKDRKKESQAYLGKFARLTRLALNHSTENSIPISEEIDLLEQYIQLEQIRFNYIFSHDITLNIAHKNSWIPPMLVQPFVENAILHGLAPMKAGGQLSIQFIDHEETTVKCIITDNGVGRVATRKERERQSLGIKLIQDRLHLLIGENAVIIEDLTVDGKAAGTKVTITIPIKINQL